MNDLRQLDLVLGQVCIAVYWKFLVQAEAPPCGL